VAWDEFSARAKLDFDSSLTPAKQPSAVSFQLSMKTNTPRLQAYFK
jgi:hypothetical protein